MNEKHKKSEECEKLKSEHEELECSICTIRKVNPAFDLADIYFVKNAARKITKGSAHSVG